MNELLGDGVRSDMVEFVYFHVGDRVRLSREYYGDDTSPVHRVVNVHTEVSRGYQMLTVKYDETHLEVSFTQEELDLMLPYLEKTDTRQRILEARYNSSPSGVTLLFSAAEVNAMLVDIENKMVHPSWTEWSRKLQRAQQTFHNTITLHSKYFKKTNKQKKSFAEDLEYFRENLFHALKIPKEYLENDPGAKAKTLSMTTRRLARELSVETASIKSLITIGKQLGIDEDELRESCKKHLRSFILDKFKDKTIPTGLKGIDDLLMKKKSVDKAADDLLKGEGFPPGKILEAHGPETTNKSLMLPGGKAMKYKDSKRERLGVDYIEFNIVVHNGGPDPECNECRGSGWYTGLEVKEPCKTCGGAVF